MVPQQAVHRLVETGAESYDHQRHSFVLKLDGYDGPMDALLDLAREQKVDLLKISIATLVEQYISFVEQAKALEIHLSAEYLVMASWLTWLKSELLLPKDAENLDEDVLDPHMMAEQLAFQLRRLDTIRQLSAGLMHQPKLGFERHACGAQYHQSFLAGDVWQADFSALVSTWASLQQKRQYKELVLEQSKIWSPHDGLRFFYRLLSKLSAGKTQAWHHLFAHLPEDYYDASATKLQKQGILASTFMACLQAAGQGEIILQQEQAFGDIHFKLLYKDG